jgi:hypothetical protein
MLHIPRISLPLLGFLVFTLVCTFTPISASLHLQHIMHQPSHGQGQRRPPSDLIKSPLIYSKYESSTRTYRTNTYPHLTTASGSWSWVGNDWWTSGFFPGTLYLLHERSRICPGSTTVNWLEKARKWR